VKLGVAIFRLAAWVALAQAPAPSQQPTTPEPLLPPVVLPQVQPPPAAIGVIVIDPAHGGADPGARGSAGILEKDVVLHFALLLRDQLQRQGLRVVLTRQGSDSPGLDDRAALANSYRSAIFISLHVASTGPLETARCYFDSVPAAPPEEPQGGLLRWNLAQQPYVEASRRLASLVQVQLKQKFSNSPTEPVAAPVRPLRNVAAPAIAVEVSSVSAPTREPLDRMAVPLAEALARAVSAFRGGGA
jgi:N-acetylmuramoyl-L-alanine amidase